MREQIKISNERKEAAEKEVWKKEAEKEEVEEKETEKETEVEETEVKETEANEISPEPEASRVIPRAQAIFYSIPRLLSQYSHSQFPLVVNIFLYWLCELTIFSHIVNSRCE